MTVVNFVQMILYVLPLLVNSQMYQYCSKIPCGGFRTNETTCGTLDHIEDPFADKCTASCDTDCIDGHCNHCFCSAKNVSEFAASSLTNDCKRIKKLTSCNGGGVCVYTEMEHSCDHPRFMINPFHTYECVLRCDGVGTDCGNGWCSASGHCICHLGYRPDVANPRTCVKIPNGDTTEMEKVCYKGFKLDSKGECVSRCECENGCCNDNGLCMLTIFLVRKVTTAFPKMSCSDKCSKGSCDADDVCQCKDCDALTTTSPNCEISQNSNVDETSTLTNNRICENSTSSEGMVSKSRHKVYVGIFVSANLILVICIIFLVYVLVMLKKALPQSEGYNLEIDARSPR